ncbi:MAG TPA: type 1 glutamine amidotransferase domain-containing protein [Polyangiaceae bacterium]|nr:type 1 glutamine amidotransferase domain-containing protein [Polyangiaceae bacterium]
MKKPSSWFGVAALVGLAVACTTTRSSTPSDSLPDTTKGNAMTHRVLLAMTSHDQKGSSGKPTGAYLPEVAHPYEVFARAGYEIEFVSVRGGQVPLDGVEGADASSLAFLEAHRAELAQTPRGDAVDASRFDVIYFAGGHGAMWDFPDDRALSQVARDIYERGGIVSAVCHGPAALVNLQLSNGQYLVAGKKVSAFTNEEERAVQLDGVVPFLLADRLSARGALHQPAPLWQKQVVVDERLVTGQNPASAAAVAEAVVGVLQKQGS